jgi:ATP-dependent Clp protease, protease subunit
MSVIPFVIESSGKGERSYDIYSRLLKDRVIFLGTPINDDVASSIIAQMLFLQLDNEEEDISMYIMSPGGEIGAALAIYDTMQYLKNDVATYCVGHAASAASFLLCAGAKGKRFALPSSRIMIHQPWGGAEGDARALTIQVREINRMKKLLYEKMAKHTGQSVKKVQKDCDRDYYMSAEQAKEYGLIDEILNKPRRKRV